MSNKQAIDGVLVSPLGRIHNQQGDLFRLMRRDDPGFYGPEEAYCTTVNCGKIKAWKRHRRMAVNLVPLAGLILLAIHDDRPKSPTNGKGWCRLLTPYLCRVTIPPNLWFGFQGISTEPNILLNLASLVHDPEECDTLSPEYFQDASFQWYVEAGWTR